MCLDLPTVVRLSRIGFILSCRSSSSKFLRLHSSASLAPYPAGVSVLFATSSRVSTRCAISRSRAMFRPQAFSSSRRFAPPCEFVGLFHPTATSRILCRSGVSPAPKPVGLAVLPCPLVVQRASLTGKPAATPCARDLEAFILGAMRSWRSVFSLPFGRSPLRVFSSFRCRGYDVNPVPRAIRLRR